MNSVQRTIVGAVLIASALIAAASGIGYSASSNSGAVLATIGTHKITQKDVDQRIKDQLTELEAEEYQVREHAIDALAAEKLLQMGAEKAHLSVDEFIKREAYDKIPNPSEQQVRSVYEAFKSQLTHPYEQEKPAIIVYLRDKQRAPFRDALINRLRSEIGVKVLLKPPRFDVPSGDHPALGPKKAPVTIVEFGDFECPYTKNAEPTLKQIRAKYGSKVRLVYIDHPLPMHPNAFGADIAARCAAEQGKFWEYHDALFADQSKLKADDLKATAARLKLDTAKFDDCFTKNKYDADRVEDQEEAQKLRVEGTPAFYINGRVLFGAASPKDFEELIDAELAHGHGKVARAD